VLPLMLDSDGRVRCVHFYCAPNGGIICKGKLLKLSHIEERALDKIREQGTEGTRDRENGHGEAPRLLRFVGPGGSRLMTVAGAGSRRKRGIRKHRQLLSRNQVHTHKDAV
jgi:hypothetical protein